MPTDGNILCTTQAQCPSIPAEYFNQQVTTSSNNGDQTELLVALTSFFGGYAALFIAFAVFTICRNKTANSRYKTPLRLIIITITILLETFDVFTDIAQANNVINGTDCGVTSPPCIKKDVPIGYLMVICVIIGTIATIISLYTFCKTTGLGMYDEMDEAKYKKLDRCTEYMKIWGENIPMLLLLVIWVFVGGEGFSQYSYITSTFLITLIITAFNFYWIVVPLICCCCIQKKHNNINNEKQNMEMGIQTAPQPIQSTAPVPVQYVPQPQKPQVLYVQQPIQQQPLQSQPVQYVQQQPAEQLPAGWTVKVDPNGRVYYQNDITQTTQWEKPITTTINTQYAPNQPSDMAPKPMQREPIEQQFSVGSVNSDNAVNTATDNAAQYSYYDTEKDEMSCCGKACVWCGAVLFTILMLIWFLWSQIFVTGATGMDQEGWKIMSEKDECILGSNFYWEIDELYSNVTKQSYPLWLKEEETSGIGPILETGNEAYVPQGFIEQDRSLICLYTEIPSPGQCAKWIFSCGSPYFVQYATDSLCVDFCAS